MSCFLNQKTVLLACIFLWSSAHVDCHEATGKLPFGNGFYTNLMNNAISYFLCTFPRATFT